MNYATRITGLFLCITLLLVCTLPSSVFAQDGITIDISHASDGYFTINYSIQTSTKMKVGVLHDNSTIYHDYTAGDTSSYAFTEGSGEYTITLYSNVTGYKYQEVASNTVNVSLKNDLAPYLVSMKEVEFSEDDIVAQTAYEICGNMNNEKKKVAAIRTYVRNNIAYDYDFAESVSNGTIKIYHPKASDILQSKKGICYDYAVLFAAMCRSQAIPCAIIKGYSNGRYHACNRVYCDGTWHDIDLTILRNNVSTIR